jgi:hypothetical protein
MAKFSMKRFVNVLVRPASDEVQLITEPDPTWQAWAADHGYEYQFDGSEFAGRYRDPPPDKHGYGEQYYNVVRGTWNDVPFTYFTHKSWHVDGRGGHGPGFSGGLVVQLPGTPRADLLAMTPEDAFKAAGGELPRSGTWEWRPPDLLLGWGKWLDPSNIEGYMQNISLQLAVAPAELWQS